MNAKKIGNKERREELLSILWDSDRPMSAQEILEAAPAVMANITYVHRTLNELVDNGLIIVDGTKRYNTQYARLFSCAFTREEYAAMFMRKIGLPAQSIGKVALALINDKTRKADKEEVLEALESVIADLRRKTKGKSNK